MRTDHVFLALLPLVAACGNLAEPRYTSPTDVALGVGQQVTVDSILTLGFLGVPADSRCPALAMCVWAGDGAVQVAYALGSGPSHPDTLHTTLDPKAALFSSYRITLLELGPYPETTVPIPQAQYVARFRIERFFVALPGTERLGP